MYAYCGLTFRHYEHVGVGTGGGTCTGELTFHQLDDVAVHATWEHAVRRGPVETDFAVARTAFLLGAVHQLLAESFVIETGNAFKGELVLRTTPASAVSYTLTLKENP